MKRDANDVENLKEETDSLLKIAEADIDKNSGWETIDSIESKNPELRNFVIQGLVREGEVINFISAPKMGKSMFVAFIAYHIAAGKPILKREYQTCGGNIAIIDTELHKETIAHRMRLVLKDLNFNPELKKKLFVYPIRGKQISIFEIEPHLVFLKNKNIKLIIFDCLYKLLPKGTDENSNADINGVYNFLDYLAMKYNVAIAVVHHTSKGSQLNKSITDMGSGAGVFQRSPDSHITFYEHEQPGHFVLKGVVRSFKQPEPFVVKFEYPLFHLADKMNPEDVKGVKKQGKQEERVDLSTSEFAEFLTDEWLSKKQIVVEIKSKLGCSASSAGLLIDNIQAKYKLESLTPQDGEKDCDFFICANIKGLKFKRGAEL